MATGVTTLLDIVQRTGSDALVGLIEDVTTYAPEFNVVPASTRAGTTYKLTRRTALPTAGFRAVNEGGSVGKSTFKQEIKEMFFLDVPLQVDEAAVQADDGSAGDFLTQEAQGALQSAIIALGTQMYYGTDADAKGFVGLKSQSVGKWPTGGTTNSTSAYLVWLNEQGVQFVVGRDGNIALPAWQRQAIIGGTTQAPTQRMAFVSNLSGFVGLQVGSASAVWRVSGITASAPLTDERGAGLLSKVPLARRTGLRWFMNRTSAYTLQKARAAQGFVATSSGGSPTQAIGPVGAFGSLPTELAGIPITITDSLNDTETNAGSADTYAAE
jgi:hypothetical protein